MQFQASLGMCLQDSETETGPGTSYTLTWKDSQKAKVEGKGGEGCMRRRDKASLCNEFALLA